MANNEVETLFNQEENQIPVQQQEQSADFLDENANMYSDSYRKSVFDGGTPIYPYGKDKEPIYLNDPSIDELFHEDLFQKHLEINAPKKKVDPFEGMDLDEIQEKLAIEGKEKQLAEVRKFDEPLYVTKYNDKQVQTLSTKRSGLRAKIDNLYKKEAETRQHGLFGSEADQALLFESDEQEALLNAVKTLKEDIDAISDNISDLKRNRESVAEREMGKDTIPLFVLNDKSINKVEFQEIDQQEKDDAQKINEQNKEASAKPYLPYAGIDEARKSFEQNADRKTRGQVEYVAIETEANETEEIRDTGTEKKGDRIRRMKLR